ncbi:MAG: hypothetical protein M0R47_19000 [Methylobacter sp.]|jgi:hypothetical protein|uniref:hypothetical protein n=1 Tax=Methylobacter sp. TaxID=2051955 RepID=UPI0025CEDD0D|nr:hypothetical protein [Methylobacter sp.]MCK9622610.1 hypothetical protein [Methylobacter sp.]
MAQMTLAEAEAQLLTVNTAISDIIAGKRVTQLRIGSGNFQREMKFSEITIEALKELRSELMEIINSYNNVAPVFRTNATIPLTVGKDLYRV